MGDLLVKVDDSVYRVQYNQADANLAHAKADLGELQAHQVQCEAEWKRADALRPKQAIADTDYDLDVANYKAAVANVKVGLATIKQCEAALAMAKRNLDYCTITSPVKGVVIDRRVNVGQTVVSAMSVSSLFLIAKDLTRMQVWASVNEADIGRIRKGMPVTFTVDAYPNETFKGTVYQIRMNATMNQNVVTYTVVVDTENPDLRLYPYLTANVSFQVERHDNVLKVPNGALALEPAAANGGPGVSRQPDSRRQRETRRQSDREHGLARQNQRTNWPGEGQGAGRSEGRRRAGTRQAAWRSDGCKRCERRQVPLGCRRAREAQDPRRARPGLDQRRIVGQARQSADRSHRRHRHRGLRPGNRTRRGSNHRRGDPRSGRRRGQSLGTAETVQQIGRPSQDSTVRHRGGIG